MKKILRLNFVKNILKALFVVFCFTTQSFALLSGGVQYLPKFKYIKNSIAAFKARLPDTDNIHNYVKTGIFFKKGAIFSPENIVAQDTNGKIYPVQLDDFNYYKDNSIRFGVVIVDLSRVQSDKSLEIHLFQEKNGQKQSVMRINKSQLPDVELTIKDNKGRQKTVSLKNANPEKGAWQTGSLMQSRRYTAKVFKDLYIDFDVEQYKNQQTTIDLVFHYDRLYDTPMSDLQYDVNIAIDKKPYKKINNILHKHHTKWRHSLGFGYEQKIIPLLNMSQLMQLNVLPQLDLTLGVKQSAIDRNYQKLLKKNPQSFLSTGLLTPAMGTTGARSEIALVPQWAAQYLLTGNEKARFTTLIHAEIAAHIPWHFYDEKKNAPAMPNDHINTWVDWRANMKNNGIQPYKNNKPWDIDVAHQPSLVYVPFIITGDRYYYDTLKAIFSFNRLRCDPRYCKKNNQRNLTVQQVRAYGWASRLTGEMHSVLNISSDGAAQYIQQRNADDMAFYYDYFIKGKILGPRKGHSYDPEIHSKVNGELTGALIGYASELNPLFMQDLASIGITFHAGLGFLPWMKQFALWQSQFVSGRFLQKHNGFPPEYATTYKFQQYVKNSDGYVITGSRFHILDKWRDVFHANQKRFAKDKKHIDKGNLPGYYTSPDIFVAYARASNAQLFNVTRNPDSLEAYGFLAQYIFAAFDKYQERPAYLIAPRFNNKVPLSIHNIKLGSDGSNNLTGLSNYSLAHGKDGDDVISLEKNASHGFIFGGEGDDTLIGGASEDFHNQSVIKQHIGGAYLFGGDGNDVLISVSGRNTLKGDENYGKGKDIFVFNSQSFYQDIIQDFNPKLDRINLCAMNPNSVNPVNMVQNSQNGDAVLTLNMLNNKPSTITLQGVKAHLLKAQHFITNRCLVK